MRKLVILTFLWIVAITAQGQETFPVNGVADDRNTLHAFINARIYVSANQYFSKGVLLVRNGKVVSVGSGLSVPKEAIVHDCEGQVIYPSFIDAYSGMNAPKKLAKTREKTKVKPANWNPAIHPETVYEVEYPLAEKTQEDWLASGFGVVNLHERDGIMRGSSSTIVLGQMSANEGVVQEGVSQHYSFSKGSSNNDYPSSHIGAIALVRQTFYDAAWYDQLTDQVEFNPSLSAIIEAQDQPKIFELNHSLSARNVLDIAKEFNLDFAMVSAGKEYLVLDEIEPTTRIIVPLNYPKALNVKESYMARMVTLSELKHWELAPYNAYLLSEHGNTLCLSRDTVASHKQFISNLIRTTQSGISHEIALEALTSNPAELLGISSEFGTLDPGKWANFIISSNTLDQEGFEVLEHWTKGRKVYSLDILNQQMVGTYNLVVEKVDYTLDIEKVHKKVVKASISKVNSDEKLNVQVNRTGDLISLLILQPEEDNKKNEVLYSLSGKVTFDGGVWDGKGQDNTGRWIEWAAIKDRKTDKRESVDSNTVQQDSVEIPAVWHPNGAFGWDTLDSLKTFVITNAVIWTASDTGTIEGDVFVVDGKIKKIGKNFLFPSDVKRINANGRHLTPGIIDEHSHIGIRGGVNEWAQSSSAEVRIADAVDPWNINIYRQLAGGVTTAQLLHGSANPIGGQSALVKLKWGKSADEMVIPNAPKFIKFALGENVKRSNRANHGNRFPLTRMGVEQSIGDAFVRAHEYQPGSMIDGQPVRRDLELDAIKEILNDERYITCHSYVQSEILMLMNLADSLNFRVNTFTHILEGYKVADEMKAHGAMASTFSDWWAYKFEVNDAIPYNAAMLTKAGITTAINSDDAEMGRRLNQEAAKTMKYGGLSVEEAIKLVTINPAIMLHLDDRIGSIEVGKDADLVLWSGNPLSVYSEVDKTFIEGVLYFDRKRMDERQKMNQDERARLIEKMILDKSSNKQNPKHKPHRHMHCDTMLEDYCAE